METYGVFSIALRELMKRRNFNEYQVALILGVQHWTVKDWLDEISLPTQFYLDLIYERF